MLTMPGLPQNLPFTASIALTLIIGQASLTGCKSALPKGRCGLRPLCSPVVMEDPFPYDENVPPKGVDFAHYGYSRPQWRVLNSRDADCCVAAEPTYPCLIEQVPLSSKETDSVPTSVTPASQYIFSTYLPTP